MLYLNPPEPAAERPRQTRGLLVREEPRALTAAAAAVRDSLSNSISDCARGARVSLLLLLARETHLTKTKSLTQPYIRALGLHCRPSPAAGPGSAEWDTGSSTARRTSVGRTCDGPPSAAASTRTSWPYWQCRPGLRVPLAPQGRSQ